MANQSGKLLGEFSLQGDRMNAVPPDAGVYENLPLHGISVVEMTHMIMGPSCGFYLAMLGADVIKVEPPEGENFRLIAKAGAHWHANFDQRNRGKRAICLDGFVGNRSQGRIRLTHAQPTYNV